MATCEPPIGRLAYPDFNSKFPNQLRNSSSTYAPLCAAGRILARAKPIPGIFQAFFKSEARVVAQHISCEGDVRLRIANVSFARRIVFCLCGPAGNFFEQPQRLIQRVPGAGADVDGESRGALRFACQQICFDHVSDISEVARMLSVSVDNGLRSMQNSRVE